MTVWLNRLNDLLLISMWNFKMCLTSSNSFVIFKVMGKILNNVLPYYSYCDFFFCFGDTPIGYQDSHLPLCLGSLLGGLRDLQCARDLTLISRM